MLLHCLGLHHGQLPKPGSQGTTEEGPFAPFVSANVLPISASPLLQVSPDASSLRLSQAYGKQHSPISPTSSAHCHMTWAC